MELISILSLLVAILSLFITSLTYLPIKGHKFSVLMIGHLGAYKPQYSYTLLLCNLKNKAEVIMGIYAEINEHTFVPLDMYRKDNSYIDTNNNPLIVEPYQTQTIYVARASYFRQWFPQDDSKKTFNYLDIINQTRRFRILLSDGKIITANNSCSTKSQSNFETKNVIINGVTCCGKIKSNGITSNFTLYNHFGNVSVLIFNKFFTITKKEEMYTNEMLKDGILKYRNLPESSIVEFDSNLDVFLSTLKQKWFPTINKEARFLRFKDILCKLRTLLHIK